MHTETLRSRLKDKKRVVIKIGSSSLTYSETSEVNIIKIEKLAKILTDLRHQGKDVILVSSGAIAAGRSATGLSLKQSLTVPEKQACAATGQVLLMSMYQRFFAQYSQGAAQILMTKYTMLNDLSRYNARNAFEELLKHKIIPIVNENDTISTYEINFGDNDRLSALVTALTGADLLLLLSDIDGLYTDDPNVNPNARFVPYIDTITEEMFSMGKSTTGSNVGTGGMSSKLIAAKIATEAGADMMIANGNDLNNITRIFDGEECGTLFAANPKQEFKILDYLED